MYETASPMLREAVEDLQRYLSDELAPLMVTDAIEMLLRQPPELAAHGIASWTMGQGNRNGVAVPISDYYYHALKKLHLMGEFKLVPHEQLKSYLDQLAQLVIEAAPPGERETLKAHLARLGHEQIVIAGAATLVHRPGGSVPAPVGAESHKEVGGVFSRDAMQGLRRFTLLLERLGQGSAGTLAPGAAANAASLVTPGGISQTTQEALLSQIFTTAALNSRSGGDLDQFLARLRDAGLEARTHEIFQALGRALPGWALPASLGRADNNSVPAASPIEAMRKIVSMAQDPAEAAGRFSELVRVATERFNEGALAQAAKMFELAESLISDKRVDASLAQRIRDTGHEALSEQRLFEFAEVADKQLLLRQVLRFFHALSPRRLFEDLEGEERRERRRLLITLLEAHGAAARTEALEILVERGRQAPWYMQRNLLHILRRIPRPADAPQEEEMAQLEEFSHAGHGPLVIKEAIAVLAQTKHARVEPILCERLKEFEKLLLAPGEERSDAGDLRSVLDRIVTALARTGEAAGVRAVVEHGLSGRAQLGDTMGRLADLGGRDLCLEVDCIKKLLGALRAELPRKVLGIVLKKNSDNAMHLIKALSGTSTDDVKREFEAIVMRFPDDPMAEEAAKALVDPAASARTVEPATSILSGDLEVFSLPNLIQSLADSGVTGDLTLSDAEGRPFGVIFLESGRLRECRTGALTGEIAFYQLFEKPLPGSFNVKSRKNAPAGGGKGDGTAAMEIMPLLLEAVRREDEYRSACALVPDNLAFRPSGSKPTRPEGESDTELLRALWTKVNAGATAPECEAVAATDSYRVRRILAHWFEEGALQPREG